MTWPRNYLNKKITKIYIKIVMVKNIIIVIDKILKKQSVGAKPDGQERDNSIYK